MANSQSSETSVTTSHHLRLWWLEYVRGYTVDSVHRVPKAGSFGRIHYKTSWVLRKNHKNKH